ncbi:hypothetical protein CEXT_353911 [Caerostris extrusa]|uniref:Uncharacterized protein n=1 Tax=Caerostris extrusa TaxID=172846 RepID=A0AAV4XES8_CAEEX|nr:hypothetical protein CEXT_353911 [Caerostris extrusa]
MCLCEEYSVRHKNSGPVKRQLFWSFFWETKNFATPHYNGLAKELDYNSLLFERPHYTLNFPIMDALSKQNAMRFVQGTPNFSNSAFNNSKMLLPVVTKLWKREHHYILLPMMHPSR